MGKPIITVNRIVVLLHGGMLKSGTFLAISQTDAYGEEQLERFKKQHMEAGAILLYDGPPNQ